jgi:N,N-dimethylformamidase
MNEIHGYSDKISVRPGETISFMVTSHGNEPYDSSLVRIVHGDNNPAGPGVKIEKAGSAIDGRRSGRRQELLAGSYAVVPGDPRLSVTGSFSVQAMIWPTTPMKGPQAILSRWDDETRAGFVFGINASGALSLIIGDGKGRVEEVSSGKAMVARKWYFTAAVHDAETGEVRIIQSPLTAHAKIDDRAKMAGRVSTRPGDPRGPLLIAAQFTGTLGNRVRTTAEYNGKIDSPALIRGAFDRVRMEQVLAGTLPRTAWRHVIARWDFGRGQTGCTVHDISANRLHGETVNMPARGMKGYNWTGREMSWVHAPSEYGAIHFHDDDVYDAGWEVDFSLTVPEGLKSGLYAAHVKTATNEDYIPFVVRAKTGKTAAKAVLLVPTASYMAYGNKHMPTDGPLAELLAGHVAVLYPHDVFLMENRNYGNSCYDVHSDGSGVCYASRLRPLLDMRPKTQSILGGAGSSLWQFNADTHIIDWLEAKGFSVDCITDEDLHDDGLSALQDYDVVLTGSHPEYWSTRMWDALEAFKERGGRLMSLGADGWYWRIAYHETKPGIMEVRRAEGGIRSWAAETGEYHHSFTGEYGGMWRRLGRPPQMMSGTGFSAQGFDVSSYYRRLPASRDARAKFIFEGVEDDIIGDFGLIGNGAAGLELDRADPLLGTPPNCLVLASSENHTDIYMVVCEEILVSAPVYTGRQSPLVRADMVFYETPSGGAVFSTSSIAWSGSLSHNGYQNNVSRITENVLRRFLDPTPF